MVYDLPDNELKNLDKREGYRPGRSYEKNQYSRQDQYVWRDGDAKRPLLVAIYLGHPQLDSPLPSDDYKRLIVDGAKYWNLPDNYIRQLESIRTET